MTKSKILKMSQVRDRLECKEENGLMKFMRGVLKQYDRIRGKSCKNGGIFWDVVLITTADEDQKKVFEEQLKAKQGRAELPVDVAYIVISDPPGPKLGNGGSTLTALSILHDKYNDALLSKRILLVHAGGQSKRMPSTSVLGKIFSPIPYGDPIYQMLDLKLALYMPFLPRMAPGVFVTCSDDILVYNLGDWKEGDWSFSGSGFTALGHPSTLDIGTKHGVYVVENEEDIDTSKHIQKISCVEVLQKPSIEKMKERKAILSNTSLKFPDGIEYEGQIAYTDSSFFFGMDVAKKLIQFNTDHGPIDCEIDAYGDFLQALGRNASDNYTSNISNVTSPTHSLIPTRKEVFRVLQGCPINLLLMNSSKFIHIGTTKEYIHHFCFDEEFQRELSLLRDVFNAWIDSTSQTSKHSKRMKYSPISDGCVMNSVIPSDTQVLQNTVVEYCDFSVPVDIGQGSIISNCSLCEADLPGDVAKVVIPHNIFIHTVPVKESDDLKTMYTTVVFHIDDNLKKEVPFSKMSTLPFLGYDIEDAMEYCHMDITQCQGQGDKSNNKVKCSLWDLSLFPLESSMTQSMLSSLMLIKAIHRKDKTICNLQGKKLISMEMILKRKDVMTMLNFREQLHSKIRQK